jgi:hypothetical protein
MVATFALLRGVDVTYVNEPDFCCRGVQMIVQSEASEGPDTGFSSEDPRVPNSDYQALFIY